MIEKTAEQKEKERIKDIDNYWADVPKPKIEPKKVDDVKNTTPTKKD